MSTDPPVPSVPGGLGLPKIPKHKRLSGQEKEAFGAAVEKAYRGRGASIRAICAESGRGFATIVNILNARGVPLRPRGGSSRRRR